MLGGRELHLGISLSFSNLDELVEGRQFGGVEGVKHQHSSKNQRLYVHDVDNSWQLD